MKSAWDIGGILTWTGQYFAAKGVENPRLDAEVLLCRVLGKDRVHLYVDFDQPLQETELAAFREMVKKRAGRLPVAYILREKEFMGLDFTVTPDVLIPRPDTEILVEEVWRRLKDRPEPRLLEVGTGSGAIAVSLLKQLPAARGLATDIAPAALAVARDNAARHGVRERLTFACGDLYEPVRERRFTAIVSNPPYIPDGDIAALAAEVRHEPRGALAGGADGLVFYRRLIAEGASFLAAGGLLALEVGAGQAAAVAALADAPSGLCPTAVVKDYGGVERVVILEKQ